MHARRYLFIVLIMSVVAVFSMALTVSAQDNSALITQSIQDMGTNCANLVINTSCLAHISVQRTASGGVVSTDYSQAGDRANTGSTHQIQTSLLNAATGEFGVNVMKVQAGLPNGSQGLIYVAFDGTTLTNVGGTGQALWQSINVSIAPTSAVPFLFIQAPQGQTTTITVNGKTLTLHSTVVVWFSEGQMRVTVIEGSIVSGNITVNVCETISAPIVNGVVGAFGPPVAGLFPTGIQYIGILSGNILNYPVIAPVSITPSGIGGVTPVCAIKQA